MSDGPLMHFVSGITAHPVRRAALAFFTLILLLALPRVLGPYHLDLLNNMGLYAVLALSLNVILGQAGLFHMGHAAFYAVGAYCTAIVNTVYQVPVLWTLPLSGALAAFFALLVARPIIHLRGDYLLVVTIGIVEIVRIVLVNDVFGLTGGNNGLFGIARPMFFGFRISRPEHFYYLIWGFLALALLFFSLLERSRFGRALQYIRQDETAAAGSGVKTDNYKLAAFAVGAFWAGMTGTIFAAKMTIITPESFTFSESVLLFAIVILGGAGNIWGVLLGAVLVVGLPELFRDLRSARMLFFGAAMVGMMVFRPQGLLPPSRSRYDAARYLGLFPCAVGLCVPDDLEGQQSTAAETGEGGA